MNHSFLKFNTNIEVIQQYIRYSNSCNRGKPIKIFNIVEVKHNVEPFKKGDLALAVTGENWCQKSTKIIERELGVSGVVSIAPLQSPLYFHFSKGHLNGFLKKNFEIVHLEDILSNKRKYKI